MCLAILSGGEIKLAFLGESIFLTFDEGRLCAREVYDVFFTPSRDLQDARLLCISPHDLLTREGVAVTSISTPGAGTPDDVVYDIVRDKGSSFDATTGHFSVAIPVAGLRFEPIVERFDGEALVPVAAMPSALGDQRVRTVLRETGTVFELQLGDLVAGTSYCMRFAVNPQNLLGIDERRPLETAVGSHPTVWLQDASISCPRSCYFDFSRLVQEVRKEREYAQAAAEIQHLLEASDHRVLIPRRQRTVLVVPHRCELVRAESVGCVFEAARRVLSDQRLALEWVGGSAEYWIDDIESCARRVYSYLREWATVAPEAKPRDALATALNMSYENCASIVDSLVRHGAVKAAGPSQALYAPAMRDDSTAERVFERISRDPEVRRAYRWIGYDIRFTVRYGYISPTLQRRLSWSGHRARLGFWLAILGIVLGAIAIILALVDKAK